ncbi:prolipoprotein diacylglyceryl transferase [bacterium]|nr:prolipoprotein diacylglyceryl transferase [bacterium]
MRPILFQLGSFPLRSYGLLMALAFMVGIWIARRRAAKSGYDPDVIIDLSVIVILVSILGARLAYVFVRWEYYRHDILGVFRIWEGGLALYGGMVAGALVGLWFFRRRGINMWAGADLVAPSLAMGVTIGRIGCFLNGCCYGKACEQPWGVVFSENSIAGMRYPGIHLHPTQLYESFLALVVFFVLLAADRRKPFEGFLLWLFVILLSVCRFLIDPVRQYGAESIVFQSGAFALTNNQVFSVALVLLSIGFMVYLSRRSHVGRGDTTAP